MGKVRATRRQRSFHFGSRNRPKGDWRLLRAAHSPRHRHCLVVQGPSSESGLCLVQLSPSKNYHDGTNRNPKSKTIHLLLSLIKNKKIKFTVQLVINIVYYSVHPRWRYFHQMFQYWVVQTQVLAVCNCFLRYASLAI